MLIDQPQDAYVEVGETAKFNCSHTGTSHIPWWRINGYNYPIELLPPRCYYNTYNQRLILSDVRLSDNSSTYLCFFGLVSSSVGMVYVINRSGKILLEAWIYN